MNKKGQLWSCASKKCQIPGFCTDPTTGYRRRSAYKAPIMHWPDGTICWPITRWLLEKYKNLSNESARGGSAGTYASMLSHLVKYVFFQKRTFRQLNDNDMYLWAELLREEKDPRRYFKKRRSNTQIGKIMRRGLEFLQWYQESHLIEPPIVGKKCDGAQIAVTPKSGKRKGYEFSCIDHPAIPNDDVGEEIKPIGFALITRLYEAILKSSSSTFLKKRRQQMLRLLEATGGRRIEVSELKISDIESAHKTGKLRLRVAKSQQKKFRIIDIEKEWLEPIVIFIQTHRKRLVLNFIKNGKLKKDSGCLFIGETTGEHLNVETITKEIGVLREIAGISGKACAHMFRHRFITLQVVFRLRAYADQELPMALAHTILTKVASITGHKDPLSLMPYIDLAYQEMGVWDTSEKVLQLKSKAEAAFREIQTLRDDVAEGKLNGMPLVEAVCDKLNKILGGLSQAN